jgi:hypothetical protein
LSAEDGGYGLKEVLGHDGDERDGGNKAEYGRNARVARKVAGNGAMVANEVGYNNVEESEGIDERFEGIGAADEEWGMEGPVG